MLTTLSKDVLRSLYRMISFRNSTTFLSWMFLLNYRVSCYTEMTGWITDKKYDDTIPTSSGYKPDITSPNAMQCARTCRRDTDCSSFVYIADTLTCKLYNTTWNEDGNVTSEVSAVYYRVSWSDVQSCSTGWTRFGDSCYLVSTSRYEFAAAQATCEGVNSNLVHINDAAEDAYVTDKCREKETTIKRGVCWLGLISNAPLVQWNFTESDQVPVYLPWSVDEPNGGAEPVYCATINGFHGYVWTDDSCLWDGFAICEKSITSQ